MTSSRTPPDNPLPEDLRQNVRRTDRILAARWPAHVVTHRSLRELIGQQPALQSQANRVVATGGSPQAHFLGSHLTVEGAKFRELLTSCDTVWGAAEIWWRVLRQRLGSAQGQNGLAALQSTLAAFPWDLWIPKGWSLRISAGSDRSALRSSSRIKEAAVAVLTQAGISVTDTAIDRTIVCRLSLFRDTLSVYLPLALESWHHRSYKAALRAGPVAAADVSGVDPAPGHPATLREDYAQAIIGGLANWLQVPVADLPRNLFVPFAGTGTFAFEYITMTWELGHALVGLREALLASSAAPEQTLRHLRTRAQQRVTAHALERPMHVWSCDTDAGHVGMLQQLSAAFESLLPSEARPHLAHTITAADAYRVEGEQFEQESQLCVLINPPFGERLARRDPTADFARIAEKLLSWAHSRTVVGAIIRPTPPTRDAFVATLGQVLKHTELPFSFGTLRASIVYFASTANQS